MYLLSERCSDCVPEKNAPSPRLVSIRCLGHGRRSIVLGRWVFRMSSLPAYFEAYLYQRESGLVVYSCGKSLKHTRCSLTQPFTLCRPQLYGKTNRTIFSIQAGTGQKHPRHNLSTKSVVQRPQRISILPPKARCEDSQTEPKSSSVQELELTHHSHDVSRDEVLPGVDDAPLVLTAHNTHVSRSRHFLDLGDRTYAAVSDMNPFQTCTHFEKRESSSRDVRAMGYLPKRRSLRIKLLI